MKIKIRLLRLVIKMSHTHRRLSKNVSAEKASGNQKFLTTLKIKWLKCIKWLARITAIGATVTGAVAVVSSSSSASAGIMLGTAGATGTYVTSKPTSKNYEKIKHVSPKLNQRSVAVNMQRSSGSHNKKRMATMMLKTTLSKRS